MEQRIFKKFVKIVYEKSGIALGPSKQSLVSARVAKRLRILGIPDYKSYLKYLSTDETGEEIVNFLDVISTNVTSFFREPDHFVFLKDAVTKLFKGGQNHFRIWCAACSSGEEPYTLAMVLHECIDCSRANIKILCTDISTQVLEIARKGIYKAEKLENVPEHMIRKYFIKRNDDEKVYYEASNQLKNILTFQRLNLSRPPFPMKGPFDYIFCRNVMIYFDNTVRQNLLKDLDRLLKPDGYLMVGHAESLTGMLGDFKNVKPSIYIKK